MDGFEKIDLGSPEPIKKPAENNSLPTSSPSKSADMVRSNPAYARRRKRFNFNNLINTKRGRVISGIIVFLVLFTIFGIILPARGAVSSAKKTYAQAKVAADALKKQDIDLASRELAKTKQELAKTQRDLNFMFYLGLIPVAGWYYNDAQHLVKAADHGIDAATVFVESVKPYADVLGLKGEAVSAGSTENRIATAVKTMGKVTPRLDDIIVELSKARDEVDKVDPNRYPPFFGGEKIRNSLTQLRTTTDETVLGITEAKPLIKVLPELLGEPKDKKYLVIFQNDKELRPTGGFMTAYAIFRFEKGVIHVDKSSDIYELDGSIGSKPSAPGPIRKYLPKVPQFNLRDTNLSPDFVESMKTFNQFYAKSSGPKVDGIIAVDTRALVAVMNILGDVEAAGTKFTTKVDPRCDCPQVIYLLEEYADRPVNYVKENRKSIIGDLMYAIMNKAFSSSPKQYWGPLFQEMIKQTAQKHVIFYSYNKDGQAGLEALNASGRIRPFEGDYLHINEANFGGAKSNMYVNQSITQDYSVKNDGTVEKTVTIDYKNPYAPSDCNLERGNLCLNATLRDWFRVYVPKGSQLIESKGSEVTVTTYEDLGKTVFEGFLTVRPRGAAKLTLTYRLPFKLDKKDKLPLMIQKQGGVDNFDYLITSRNRDLEKFKLDTDKELKLDLPR